MKERERERESKTNSYMELSAFLPATDRRVGRVPSYCVFTGTYTKKKRRDADEIDRQVVFLDASVPFTQVDDDDVLSVFALMS